MTASKLKNDTYRVTIGHIRRANIENEHEDPYNLRIQISEKMCNFC